MADRLALLSDIHANGLALEACLEHVRAQGIHRVAILGDLVGYGPEPAAVVERVMELVGEGAAVIRGNHDELAVNPPATLTEQGDITARWTHEQLSQEHRAFLAGLSLVHVLDDCVLVHASTRKPESWEYIDSGTMARRCLSAAQTDWGRQQVFAGHVHDQVLYFGGDVASMMAFRPVPGVAIPVPAARAFVATVGSVGQPRDGDPRAMYVVHDPSARRLTFHRVAYDHLAAAARVRRAGLPESLAQRLEHAR